MKSSSASPASGRRVALVGAGYIAAVHAQVLAGWRTVDLVAICDPARDRARSLADKLGISRVHGSVAELIAAGGIDAAHVLVPPELHVAVAQDLLTAGIDVLVEKPLALTSADAKLLGALASRLGRRLWVNHNMVFQPGLTKLRADLEAGRLGRLEHLDYLHWVPLRQLDTGEVGHFMFRSPGNILLEQGVHPLSVIYALLGRCRSVTTRAEPPRRLANGAPFIERWSVAMACERGTARLLMAFGRTWNEQSLTAIGTDGTARVDFNRATYVRQRKTRWLDFWDTSSNTISAGRALVRQGFGSTVRFGLGLVGLDKLPDDYLRSMAASVRACHSGGPACQASDAEHVLAMVEAIAQAAEVSWQPTPVFRPMPPAAARPGEVVVTGGSGFLGRHLVPALQAAGHPVTLLVRRPELLSPSLRDPTIRIVVGDARDPETMRRAVEGAAYVVHMATCAGGLGESMEAAMRAGVRAVGEACLAHGVQRLLFISSVAALYLGDAVDASGEVPPDPKPRARAGYARGKIAAEHELQQLVRDRGLRTVVLRPAIVVGAGGTAAHSGVGLWVRDNVCVGWGMGVQPLPFVLASDVASAIVKSLTVKGIDGRAYNLAGGVRWTAPQYVNALRAATGRDLRFHAQPVWATFVVEAAKWGIKVVARRPAEWPSRRDFRSRGFFTDLDCRDAERDLDWHPERDAARFAAEAIAVHAQPPERWTPAETTAPREAPRARR